MTDIMVVYGDRNAEILCYFFFQAEDGIRGFHVTGVQTCALPISLGGSGSGERFGEERVLGHVVRMKDRPAREILESVHADLAGFTGGAPPADDRTVVILKV